MKNRPSDSRDSHTHRWSQWLTEQEDLQSSSQSMMGNPLRHDLLYQETLSDPTELDANATTPEIEVQHSPPESTPDLLTRHSLDPGEITAALGLLADDESLYNFGGISEFSPVASDELLLADEEIPPEPKFSESEHSHADTPIRHEATAMAPTDDPEAIKKDRGSETQRVQSDFVTWLENLTAITHTSSQEHQPPETDIEVVQSADSELKEIPQEVERFPQPSSTQHQVDDGQPVSEALADLYAQQGYIQSAKEMYQKLAARYPEKSRYFAAKIEKLIST